MSGWFQSFSFSIPAEQLATQRKNEVYTAFSGANNCGKSAILKGMWTALGAGDASFLPVSRFFQQIVLQTMPHMPVSSPDPYSFMMSSWNQDTGAFDPSAVVRILSDVARENLFKMAYDWIGVRFAVGRRDPSNQLSEPVLISDGTPIEQTSTGTRLLFTLLAFCSDERNKTILIDEPEIGLSPSLQVRVSKLLMDPAERTRVFPHLNSVIVATHSHIFLDKINRSNNYAVTRSGQNISIDQTTGLQDFHNLQFNLLGNSLESYFLPDLIVIVEGKTDLPFFKRAIRQAFPDKNITVVESQGSPKDAVRRLSHPLGGLSTTPYAKRTIVIFDKVHNKDQKEEVLSYGIPDSHVVIWDKNGVEYLYPAEIMDAIFSTKNALDKMEMQGDLIIVDAIRKTKRELSDEVSGMINANTSYPVEMKNKLIGVISNLFET